MKKILSSVLLVSASVQAEVPNVFTPKTAAKASEVNDNFAYLEGRINQVAGVSDGDSSTAPTISCFNNAVDTAISYSSKTAALGTSLTLNGEVYKLTKFRVEDRSTDTLYDITMPIRFNSSSGGYVTASGSMSDLGSSLTCADTKISDFSVAHFKNLGVNYSDYYTYSNKSSADAYRWVSVTTNFSIVLGKSLFSVNYTTKEQTSKTVINSGDYDMSDNYIPFDPDMSAYVTEIDNLIDYIQIQQVTQ